jgi:hypothetical protein
MLHIVTTVLSKPELIAHVPAVGRVLIFIKKRMKLESCRKIENEFILLGKSRLEREVGG